MRDDLFIAAAVDSGADLAGQFCRLVAILVLHGNKAHSRVAGRQTRTQTADAARADHGKAYGIPFDDLLLNRRQERSHVCQLRRSLVWNAVSLAKPMSGNKRRPACYSMWNIGLRFGRGLTGRWTPASAARCRPDA